MMNPQEIARHFRQKGEEVTPDEIRETLASIAAKLRAACPELPDNDEELFKIVLANVTIIE